MGSSSRPLRVAMGAARIASVSPYRIAMPRVFLSHSSKDKEFVRELDRVLAFVDFPIHKDD